MLLLETNHLHTIIRNLRMTSFLYCWQWFLTRIRSVERGIYPIPSYSLCRTVVEILSLKCFGSLEGHVKVMLLYYAVFFTCSSVLLTSTRYLDLFSRY